MALKFYFIIINILKYFRIMNFLYGIIFIRVTNIQINSI